VGTAEAVRKNLKYINSNPDDIISIFSGDQLYRMNLIDIIEKHKNSHAGWVIAANAVPEQKISSFGIMDVDDSLKVQKIIEKRQHPELVTHCVLLIHIRNTLKDKNNNKYYLSSIEYMLSLLKH
jgi:glucose-1-phosphate adenylyltransferase